MKKILWVVIAILMLAISGCYEEPLSDHNNSEEKPGNDEWGNPVEDLSLSPDGRFVVRGSGTSLNVIDLKTNETRSIKIDESSRKLVFGRGTKIYISQDYSDDEIYDNCMITELDLETGEHGRSWTGKGCVGISIDRTETVVAAWNKNNVFVVNTVTGLKYNYYFKKNIEDVKWLPLTDELAVVTRYGSDELRVNFLSPLIGKLLKIPVGNCPDFLNVSPDGRFGAIASWGCETGVVSLIDLKKHKYVRIIRGSRMVEFTPNGKFMVNLAEKSELINNYGIEMLGSYNLVFTDTENFISEVVKLGNYAPQELIIPNNEQILIKMKHPDDGDLSGSVLDMKSEKITNVEDLNNYLREYVVASDGKEIFAIKDSELYRLDLQDAQVEKIDLNCGPYYWSSEFCKSEELTISPDGDKIILGMVNGIDYAVFNVEYLKIEKMIRMESQSGE